MNETKRNFRVGSSVTEKGEGPILRIIRISKDGKQAVCSYYEGSEMKCGVFETKDLVPILKFKIGDKVEKKEGGPVMTVNYYSGSCASSKFLCSWPIPGKEENDGLQCRVFGVDEIKLANE
ncbi:MAG: DUF2158 domain-containing protein [Candidatus Portiera sp.]|nr:DUF2158 domain-containing protein [Portiera sp.]